ncbi:hypothetical protein [Azotobacter vinelandii]|uniref:hypothetical protein n=1 Tax=Azotobacter vinelandii TaxID=354 RepID=UPI00266680C5|nr:hypothetical protein [Azotobacter vinelandii]WKN21018.1 hypothetical protein AVAEIV_004069 [Azotobacter vinelandii]
MFSKLLIGLLGPLLKALVGKVLDEFSDWLFERLREMLRRRRTTNLGELEARAAQADERARRAGSADEAREQEAVARVWCEVAEMFRRENEALKAELEGVRRGAGRRARQAMATLPIGQVVESVGKASEREGAGSPLQLDGPAAERE